MEEANILVKKMLCLGIPYVLLLCKLIYKKPIFGLTILFSDIIMY